MIFMLLKSKASLREICTGMNIYQNNFYHIEMNQIKKLSPSSISDAMAARPSIVFEDFFNQLLEKVYQYDNLKYSGIKKRKKKRMKLIDSEGTVQLGPFDIPIGKCAVVRDKCNNKYVILDMSKGKYITGENKNVTGVEKTVCQPKKIINPYRSHMLIRTHHKCGRRQIIFFYCSG